MQYKHAKGRLGQKIASIIAVISLVTMITNFPIFSEPQVANADVELNWPSTPTGAIETTVNHGPLDQLVTKLVETDNTDSIVVWYEDDNPGPGQDKTASIKAQKFNDAGVEQWTAGGVTVHTGTDIWGSNSNNPTFIPVPDGTNGVFVIFQTYSTWSYDTLAVHVSSAGTVTGPTILVDPVSQTTPTSEATLKTVIDDQVNGGFIIAYQGRPASYNTSEDYVFVQKFNGSMVKQWNSGHANCIGGTEPECGMVAFTDTDGGVPYNDVGAHIDMVKSGTNLIISDAASSGYGNSEYIIANSLDLTTGVRAGIAPVLFTKPYSSIDNTKVEIDGSGGVYLVWDDSDANEYQYAKLDSTANIAAGCTPSSSTIDTRNDYKNLTLLYDYAGGFHISYVNGSGLKVAHITDCAPAGTITSAVISTPAAGNNIRNAAMVRDGSGGFNLTWLDAADGWPLVDGKIYAQHIDSTLTSTFSGDFEVTTATEGHYYTTDQIIKNNGVTPGFTVVTTTETEAPNGLDYGLRGLMDNFIIRIDNPNLVTVGDETYSWSPSAVPLVSPTPEDFDHDDKQQKSLKLGSDYIVMWTSRLGTTITLRAQKYDSDGAGQWNGGSAAGVIVGTYDYNSNTDFSYDAVVSGSDILFLVAEGNSNPAALKDNVAVKISGTDGSVSAGPNTISRLASDKTVYMPHLIEDGSGGAFAVWSEQCPLDGNCATTNPNNSNDAVVSHISSSATVDGGWNTGNGGVPIKLDHDTTDTPPNSVNYSTCTSRIVPDGAGGFIALVLSTKSDSASTCGEWDDSSVRASRFDANGNATYANYAVASGPGTVTHFDAVSDGSNGALISYNTKDGDDFGTFAQRVDGSGNALFPWGSGEPEDGEYIAGGTGSGLFKHELSQIVTDDAGGAIIAWNYTNNDNGEYSVLAQRINNEGDDLWTEGGENASTGTPSIQFDNGGGGGGLQCDNGGVPLSPACDGYVCGSGNPTCEFECRCKSFHISQEVESDLWEEKYIQPYGVEYSTHNFEFNKVNDQVKLRIVQQDAPFGDIEQIQMDACEQDLSPAYAKYVESGEDVSSQLAENDLNVIVAHEKDIELAWDIPADCNDPVTMSMTANEYGHANPFSYPGDGFLEFIADPSINTVLDGNLDEVAGKTALYEPYWTPVTGHPDGTTYIYASGDNDNVYLSFDITMDNTDDYGMDYLEVTIKNEYGHTNEYRVDDYDDTYGLCGFGETDKVSYTHQTCEIAIPKESIGSETFEFNVEYYGTGGGGLNDKMQIEPYNWFWDDTNKPYTQSIAADGSGGVYIAYVSLVGGEEYISVQNLDSDGNQLWTESETHAETATAGIDQYPIVMAGSTITLWQNSDRGTSDVYGQNMADQPYTQPVNDTIEIHASISNVPSEIGMGVSNGDDSATDNYPDINWDYTTPGTPTMTPTPTDPPNPGSLSGATAFTFDSGTPTQTATTQAFDSVTWVDVPASGGGVLTDADNQYSTDIPLGFTITLYGRDVDTIRITTDGFVYLNSAANLAANNPTYIGDEAGKSMSATGTAPFNATVDGSATGDILVSALWTRIDSTKGSGQIRYFSDSLNEVFLVYYENVEHFDSGNLLNSEIKIRGNGVAGDGGGAGGPVCGGLGPGEQCGVFTLNGTTDIFFEGWDQAGTQTPANVTFSTVTASASPQETTLDLTNDAWTDTQFIGVLDLSQGDTWTLSVTGPGTFENSGSTQDFTPTLFEAETSVHEWAAPPTIDTYNNTNSYTLTVDEAGSGSSENENTVYYVDGNSSYTYNSSHVLAPLNQDDTFDWASTSFTHDISSQTPILTNASDEGELGIFGTGINFNLGIPGGTSADSYSGTIVYTLGP